MADPFSPSKPTPTKIQLISSSAFLFSISLSLFSLSFFFLSSRDTSFWFFLSNAIIVLIAAADSNPSSSSKPRPDLYDEYLKATPRPRITYPIPETTRTEEKMDPSLSSLPVSQSTKTEDKKDSVSIQEDPTPLPESTAEEKEDSKMESSSEELEKKGEDRFVVTAEKEKYVRSNSERAMIIVDSDDHDKKKKDKALRRSETENGGQRTDDGDFSAMSNEELNKRVEEFIRKFNREIWLQEMRERKKNHEI